MYSVDDLDTLTKLTNVLQSDVGAPMPMILCGENFLHLAYILRSQLMEEEACALVGFDRPYAHMFGPPNDEAFHGHPLASRGLRPNSAFEVSNSSWIRELARMNSVHPYHKPERFAEFKHFIFAFHDSTFECVAKGFEISRHIGSVSRILRESWPKEFYPEF